MALMVNVYVELDDDGEVAWWADADAVPGFYAAAPSLRRLMERANECLLDEFDAVDVAFRLCTAGDGDQTEAGPSSRPAPGTAVMDSAADLTPATRLLLLPA